MNIQVNDFQWEPGKNDAEYIKLLESSRDEWQKIAQKAIAKLKALSKAQGPRLVTESDFNGADEYGYIPVWTEEKDGDMYWECIPKAAITDPDGIGVLRYWTSRPSKEEMEAIPWERLN